MARAKVESQDHGTMTKGHGLAMTKWPYGLLRRKHELKVGDNLNKQFGSTSSKRNNEILQVFVIQELSNSF